MRLPYLCLALLLLSVSLPAQYTCSIQTITGYYGYSYQGTVFVPGPNNTFTPTPTALLGTITITGDGKATSHWYGVMGTARLEGDIKDSSITVNGDCTGIARYKLTSPTAPMPPGELIEHFAILGHGDEIRTTLKQGAMGQPVGSGVWKRIARNDTGHQCRHSHVVGRYSYISTGSAIMPGPGGTPINPPVVVFSTGSVDQAGKLKAPFTWYLGPMVLEGEISDGLLSVANDCTGTYRFKPKILTAGAPDPGEILERVIVFNGGDEIHSMEVQGGEAMGTTHIGIAVWKRISRFPN
jgi:hypothetical protein